ncbi:MAG: type II toxin-antitoxin system VapC family toxin [Spirochaetia bacterium]|nr:type II toxin-antitoxin system VapC family toxin [Spirochaetia bacterium]
MIIDTDVIIWYLRGNEKAKELLYKNIPFKMSVITYMEIVQGMKDKKELLVFQKHIRKWDVEIVQIYTEISSRAMFFVEDYFLSHSMELSDAIIAATGIQTKDVIITANDKHYKFIPNIQLEKFKP